MTPWPMTFMTSQARAAAASVSFPRQWILVVCDIYDDVGTKGWDETVAD